MSGLFNGDTGVVVDGGGRGVVAVVDAADGPREVALSRLADVADLSATTVHKAQGSEVDAVTVVLPPVGSRLLTRELLYTAVTRARRSVRVVGTPEAVLAAVGTPVRRATGLSTRVAPVR